MANSTVTPKEFITIWQTSNSIAEVAERTGLTIKKVYQRKASYKKKGVALKTLGRQTEKVNWDELKALAEQLSPDKKTTPKVKKQKEEDKEPEKS